MLLTRSTPILAAVQPSLTPPADPTAVNIDGEVFSEANCCLSIVINVQTASVADEHTSMRLEPTNTIKSKKGSAVPLCTDASASASTKRNREEPSSPLCSNLKKSRSGEKRISSPSSPLRQCQRQSEDKADTIATSSRVANGSDNLQSILEGFEDEMTCPM